MQGPRPQVSAKDLAAQQDVEAFYMDRLRQLEQRVRLKDEDLIVFPLVTWWMVINSDRE